MYEETNDTLLKQLAAQYRLEGEKLELVRNFLIWMVNSKRLSFVPPV